MITDISLIYPLAVFVVLITLLAILNIRRRRASRDYFSHPLQKDVAKLLRKMETLTEPRYEQEKTSFELPQQPSHIFHFGIILFIYLLVQIYLSKTFTLNYLSFSGTYSPRQSILITYFIHVWEQLSRVWLYELVPLLLVFLAGITLVVLRRPTRLLRSVLLLFWLVAVYLTGDSISLYLAHQDTYDRLRTLTTRLSNPNNLSPLGIYANATEIVSQLKNLQTLPKIVSRNDDPSQMVLLTIARNQADLSPFYKNVLVPAVLGETSFDVSISSNIFLLSNQLLVIKEVDKDTIEKISPALVRLLLKQHFNQKYIQEAPIFEVMGRQEYLKFRDDQINTRLATIDYYVNQFQSAIESYTTGISEATSKIETNRRGLAQAVSLKGSEIGSCKTSGYTSYYTGTFYRYYSDSQCEDKGKTWDVLIAGWQKNINDWSGALDNYRSLLSDAEDKRGIIIKFRSLIASQKEWTPDEYGMFEPPLRIKVVLESTSNRELGTYLSTATHEYLHYSSYVSEERSLPRFFEEGLTEYFSRQAIAKELNLASSIGGYPTVIPIIKKIYQDLPEGSLERIYFTKDEEYLMSLLDNKYGKNFYKDNEYYFSVIPYLQGEEAVNSVNKVMSKIGGQKISEADIY